MKPALTYANLASTLALAVALSGGVAVAAGALGPNTVGTKQLKKNAVVSKKVKDGSLQKADFAAGQLPVGPAGPQGLPGAPGSPGADGAPGATPLATLAMPDGAVAAQSCAGLSAGSIDGVATGDSFHFSPDLTSGINASLIHSSVLASAQTVTWVVCNPTASAINVNGGHVVNVWVIPGLASARPQSSAASRPARPAQAHWVH